MNSKYAIISVIVVVLSITSCNVESKKGSWSQADKDKFYDEMATVDLDELGAYKDEWIACYYQKVEQTFSSFEKADVEQEGCEKLAMECLREVLSSGSEKGNWSESDKERYYSEMESVDLSGFGDDREAWLECYLNKVESTYASLVDADADAEGCRKLADECLDEISQ